MSSKQKISNNFFNKTESKYNKNTIKKSGIHQTDKEKENQHFNAIVNQTRPPISLHVEQDSFLSPVNKTPDKNRKNSSNLPTANNSKKQTPKSSFDKSDQCLDIQNLPYFDCDKFSKHKLSYDSSENESNGYEDYIPPSLKSKAGDFKIKYKTELCKYFEINGSCKFDVNCAYAHGKENLRSKVTRTSAYKTRKCNQFFENGFCPYGSRCQFAHEIKSNIINNPYDKNMSYRQMLEMIKKTENILNIKQLIPKQRLSVFEDVVINEEEIKSTLFDDIKQVAKEKIYLKTMETSVNFRRMRRGDEENINEDLTLLKEKKF